VGCPPLANTAFQAELLEEQLKRVTADFFADPRNFQIDSTSKVIRVNSILSWYEEDFGDLREYISAQVDDSQKEKVKSEEFQFEFNNYDWSLNNSLEE